MLTDSLRGVCNTLYFPQSLTIRSESTRKQYLFALNDFCRFLGREPIIEDLRKPIIIGFLKWLESVSRLAPKTCNERTGRLRALWSWLFEEGMVTLPPPRNVRIPEPEKMPTAWTAEELRRLYIAAGEQPGQVSGIHAGLFWQTLLCWLWNSGSRYGETMALEWSMVDTCRQLVIIPPSARKGRKKTGRYALWPDTLKMLESIRTELPNVFPWDKCEGSYYHTWDVILKRAGLPTGRNRKTQSIRVSHATWLAASGGDATGSLMHSDAATTRKHYIDSSITTNAPKLFGIGAIS